MSQTVVGQFGNASEFTNKDTNLEIGQFDDAPESTSNDDTNIEIGQFDDAPEPTNFPSLQAAVPYNGEDDSDKSDSHEFDGAQESHDEFNDAHESHDEFHLQDSDESTYTRNNNLGSCLIPTTTKQKLNSSYNA